MLLIAVTDKNRKGVFSLTMVYRQKNTREGLPIFWGSLRCLSPFRTCNPLCEATTPLHHHTTTPLHHHTTASLHHHTTASLHHHTTASLHHYTTTPGAVDYGGCDYGECDYGGCDYGGWYGLLVRVWVMVWVRVWVRA